MTADGSNNNKNNNNNGAHVLYDSIVVVAVVLVVVVVALVLVLVVLVFIAERHESTRHGYANNECAVKNDIVFGNAIAIAIVADIFLVVVVVALTQL